MLADARVSAGQDIDQSRELFAASLQTAKAPIHDRGVVFAAKERFLGDVPVGACPRVGISGESRRHALRSIGSIGSILTFERRAYTTRSFVVPRRFHERGA